MLKVWKMKRKAKTIDDVLQGHLSRHEEYMKDFLFTLLPLFRFCYRLYRAIQSIYPHFHYGIVKIMPLIAHSRFLVSMT